MKRQRGVTLITSIAIVSLFLAIALTIASIATGNSQTVGNVYQKQQYYDVAEAGIDRGLADADSTVPSPGATCFPSCTPPPPSPSPQATQSPLANVPGISYTYSYWYNSGTTPTSTPDPYQNTKYQSSSHTVTVPPHGLLIWANTTVGIRDVAVEAIASQLSAGPHNCALCAGSNIQVTGSTPAAPPTDCTQSGNTDKICTDPLVVPTPTFVPIVLGGTYSTAGNCSNRPCSYGGGSGTPNPAVIQQNASSSTLAGIFSSQGSVAQLSNTAAWQSLASTNSNVKVLDCSGGCTAAQYQAKAPLLANQITYVIGDFHLSGNTSTVTFGGVLIARCASINGGGGNNQSIVNGTTSNAMVMTWGTDTTCGGYSIFVGGNGVWNALTAYAATGSVHIQGSGNTPWLQFYGAIIASGSIVIDGNGNFSWDSALSQKVFNFGPYTVDSFAQY